MVLKWFIPEPLHGPARALLAQDNTLLAPTLLLPEAANALWKKVRRSEIAHADAARIMSLLSGGMIVLRPLEPLIERALALALELDHPVYDCLYLALAEAHEAALVTADDGFARRAAERGLADRVALLHESPSTD